MMGQKSTDTPPTTGITRDTDMQLQTAITLLIIVQSMQLWYC